MKRVALTLLLFLVLAPTADAKWPYLSQADGRAALNRAFHRMQAWGDNSGFELRDCRRLSKRTILCLAIEQGVEWAGDVGEWSWWVRAKRVSSRQVIVYNPAFEPNRFARRPP